MSVKFKTESVQEFLARGGKVQTVPEGYSIKKKIRQLESLKNKLFDQPDQENNVLKVEAELARCHAAVNAWKRG